MTQPLREQAKQSGTPAVINRAGAVRKHCEAFCHGSFCAIACN
jgi:hypothetical protein